MIRKLLRGQRELTFDRTYPVPPETVWAAWTEPEQLARWWGVEHTSVPVCELDLRVGGQLRLVVEAGEPMGKYAGTRWPMEGTFTAVEPHHHLAYDARSWTEGEQDTSTIIHHNELTLQPDGAGTALRLTVAITSVGSGARMATFGMKFAYRHQLDTLGALLTTDTRTDGPPDRQLGGHTDGQPGGDTDTEGSAR